MKKIIAAVVLTITASLAIASNANALGVVSVPVVVPTYQCTQMPIYDNFGLVVGYQPYCYWQ